MTFDAKNFLNMQVSGPMATSFGTVPPGEYMARIDDDEEAVSVDEFAGKKDPSKSYVRATIQWLILDEALKSELGRDTLRVRQQFFLDIDDTGHLASGKTKNAPLGQIREALGMNDGQFTPSMLRGAGPALIKVIQRPDPSNPEIKYSEVSRVTALRR